jgi:hypothetical protein
MSRDYPVQIEVTSPPRFDRAQIALRIAIAIALGWLGLGAGSVVGLLYVVLPLVAAISIAIASQRGAYLAEVAPPLWRGIDWLLRFSAYMLLLVDRLPSNESRSVVTEIHFTGRPGVASALARLVTSVPSGVVLLALWPVSGVLWVVGVVSVLLGLPVPRPIVAFQRGVLRWQARLVAYHASFVAEYPPWSFDTEPPAPGAAADDDDRFDAAPPTTWIEPPPDEPPARHDQPPA